jgi:two-component system, response regulator PdtaR
MSSPDQEVAHVLTSGPRHAWDGADPDRHAATGRPRPASPSDEVAARTAHEGPRPALPSLRVVVAVADAVLRARLADDLMVRGHVVVAQPTTGVDAVTGALATRPDVVLLDRRLATGPGGDAAALIGRGTSAPAVVLVVDECDVALSDADLAGGAVTVLSTRALPAQLECVVRLAAARGRELAAARADAAGARQELADRKTMERAKGILMRRTGSSEQEALRILQHSSEANATPLVALARAVLESEPGLARA